MLSVFFVIVIAAGLLFLTGIAFGKFCQLSNDDRDDFREEWRELNRSRRRSGAFQKVQQFLSHSRKTVHQPGNIIELDAANRTGNAPGKG